MNKKTHQKKRKRQKPSEHNMSKLRKAETGEEEKEGDQEQETIEGRRRRRGKKKKQGTSDLEVENSEMGCETQYERENQEGPGETKGDTEKLRKSFFGGGNRCFLCFLFFSLVHTNQNLRKKGNKQDNL